MDVKITPVSQIKLQSKNGTKEKIVYHINRKDNKVFNSTMFRDTYKVLEKKYGVNNLMVRASNNTGIFTFKSFAEDELNFINFHEYYENKVKSIDEFGYFYNMEVTVLK